MMNFDKFIKKFKQNTNKKNMNNMVIILLIGIFIIIAASTFKTTKKTVYADKSDNNNNTVTDEEYKSESELENKLKYILERIDGVGSVEVMMYFGTGEEQIPAYNSTDSTNFTEEKDNEGGVRNTTEKNTGTTVVMTNNGSDTEPIILKKYKPNITGVIVVAEGADDKITEYKITQAVIKLFDIPADKVNVYAMKK